MRPDVGKVDDDVCDGGGRHCRRLQEEVDVQEHGDRREAQQGAHEGRVQLEHNSKQRTCHRASWQLLYDA